MKIKFSDFLKESVSDEQRVRDLYNFFELPTDTQLGFMRQLFELTS
jgi:hypothetical protein